MATKKKRTVRLLQQPTNASGQMCYTTQAYHLECSAFALLFQFFYRLLKKNTFIKRKESKDAFKK